MTKLFAYGCSYTYGHGLEDCIIGKFEPGLKPSKLGYASILGQKLNFSEVINYSRPGTSNKWITHAINLTSKHISKNDAVIVQWTFIDRSAILRKGSHTNLNNHEPIGWWRAQENKQSLSAYYYEHIYDRADHVQVTSWYVKFVDLLLKSQGITKILHTSPPKQLQMKNFIPDNITWWEENISKYRIDSAQDSEHPGPKSHELFANRIVEDYGDYLK